MYHAPIYYVAPVAMVFLLKGLGLSNGAAFGVILDFTGGLAASMTSFVLPGAFYVKLMSKDAPLYSQCLFMLIFGIAVVFVVPIATIVQLV
jgi:hypothetical protein